MRRRIVRPGAGRVSGTSSWTALCAIVEYRNFSLNYARESGTISLGGTCSNTIRRRYAVAFPGIARRMAQGRTMPFDQHHEPRLRAGLDRRDRFKGTTVTGGLAATGTSGIGAAHAQPGAHSGMLHAQAGIDRMGQQVLSKEEPWISGSHKLIADHGTTSGGFDDLGFGTLTHTR